MISTRRVVLVLLAAVLLTTGCASTRPAPATPTPSVPPSGPSVVPPAPVTVPLEVTGSPLRLTAAVVIGGATLRVLVDTGSSGLRVPASRVPPGAAEIVGPAPRYGYGSGVQLAGNIARVRLRVGPVDSPAPVAIELVTGTSCAPAKPHCSAAHGRVPRMFGGGLDGILGIRTRNEPAVPNPLWSLGAVGHSYVVHFDPAGPSNLVLGAPPDGFVESRLRPGPTAGPGGAGAEPGWVARLPLCFGVPPGLHPGPVCGPTLLDTGTPALAAIRVPGARGRAVPPSSPITLGTPDRRWSAAYTTGQGRAATISPTAPHQPGTIAGLPVFAHVDVRFDLARGTIGFRPR